MNKLDILTELQEYDVPVHDSWTVPKLRSILIEQRKERGLGKTHLDPMAGITKKTLDELMAEARAHNLDLPPKLTRGLLIRMLRGSKTSSDEMVVNFGWFKGFYSHEVPQSYQTWAIRETKSGGSHPDLVRFSNWAKEAEAKQAQRKAEATGMRVVDQKDDHSRVPPPTMEETQLERGKGRGGKSAAGSSSDGPGPLCQGSSSEPRVDQSALPRTRASRRPWPRRFPQRPPRRLRASRPSWQP